MDGIWDVVIIGSGNAGLCAGIAALEGGASVLIIEKADIVMAGGNTKYTAGAMRFVYEKSDDLLSLIANQDDPRIKDSDFGNYTKAKFEADLLGFNDGRPLSPEQEILIAESYPTLQWLASHQVKFSPTYARQSFLKDGKHVFWGGLSLEADHEGVGLFDMEMAAYKALGGQIIYDTAFNAFIMDKDRICGIKAITKENIHKEIHAKTVILACGGFEANQALRQKYMGNDLAKARVRGTPNNTGDGILAALEVGAMQYGHYLGCHATPMDYFMPEYGNLTLPHGERKNYRKICYFLGVMLNSNGHRFVDEGKDFRNYTYAQFGLSILEQPNHRAWQIFDAKVLDLLYGEYKFHDAHYIEAESLEALIAQLDGLDGKTALKTIEEFNQAVQPNPFDPTIKDGKATKGLNLPKSNWAQAINRPPFRAYPVTGGITFTYGGLKISDQAKVLNEEGKAINGLYACGELVGGVFFNGYPGGSGLTSGAVFGKKAGTNAALQAKEI